MNFEFLSDYYIIPIFILCMCIGYVLKHWMPTDNRIIPTIVCIVGAICGVVMNGFTVMALAGGAFSGLASTGAHQLIKQFTKENFGVDIDGDNVIEDYEDEEEVEEDEEE